VLGVSAEPQSSQNTDESTFSAPHFGHRLEIGLPHAAQNFLLLLLSVPHFEQRINPPRLLRATQSCIKRPLADIADSGAVEPKVQGGFSKSLPTTNQNRNLSLKNLREASQSWSTGPLA
jgi:hypothetical protein